MHNTMKGMLLVISSCVMPPQPETPSAREAEVRHQVAEYPLGPMEDAAGNLWMGSVGSGVMQWDGDTLRYFHAEQGLVGDRVTGLTRGPEGDLWFVSAEEHMGGQSALMVWSDNTLIRAEHPIGFPPNPTEPYFDQSGSLWLQSEGKFHREVNGAFVVFSLPEPSLPRTNTTGYEPMRMLQMRNGHCWFSTSDQGAYRWDGEGFTQFTVAEGLPTNNVKVHLEDRQGNLWFSCFHWHQPEGEQQGALCRWDGKSVATFPEILGLTENEIYSVLEDREGNLWIGATGHGVYRYDGQHFTLFSKTHPEVPDFRFGCNSIYQDRKGQMWFGFAGGLYRLEGETFVNVTRAGPWE